MSRLSVPVICTVIGEGGSGGALAIGVGDKVNMLQYSTYSVISPEGCASILWKSADKGAAGCGSDGHYRPASERAEADRFYRSGTAGRRSPQPGSDGSEPGVAQLLADLADLDLLSEEELLNRRYQRLMSYGYA